MTYNFPDHESGTTFPGVKFELLVNSVAKNLTNTLIELTMANRVLSTVTGEIVITDAAAGKFEFPAQIVKFSPKTHKYEITFTFPDGTKKTYLEGTWKFNS